MDYKEKLTDMIGIKLCERLAFIYEKIDNLSWNMPFMKNEDRETAEKKIIGLNKEASEIEKVLFK